MGCFTRIYTRRLIIEAKAEALPKGIHERQLMNYLRCTNLEVGLLLLFGIKPEFRRLIHTRDRKNMQVNPCEFPSIP